MGKGMIAEFVGTFALMFVGGAAIICGGDLVHVALAHGLILGVMVSAVMHISGGQFNPAVAIALAMSKKQSWGQAAAFMATQCAGAIAAAFILQYVFDGMPGLAKSHVGATLGEWSTGEDQAIGKVLALEAIATFFLMFVILGSAADSRSKTTAVAGFAIGLTVAADILAIGPLTGASMNPARSFGPALVSGAWAIHWAYWVAPILGACAAAGVWGMMGRDRG